MKNECITRLASRTIESPLATIWASSGTFVTCFVIQTVTTMFSAVTTVCSIFASCYRSTKNVNDSENMGVFTFYYKATQD